MAEDELGPGKCWWEQSWSQGGLEKSPGECRAGSRSEEHGYRMRGWEVSGADIMSVSGIPLKRINKTHY